MKPDIAVITPVYNGESFIRDTIDSVLSQSYGNFQYIIIDDCSDDSTEMILNEYSKLDSRINVHRNKVNSGPLVSRNYGIDLADAEYIAFIDGDDIWKPTKLEKQLSFMRSNKEHFTYTDFAIFKESNKDVLRSVHCMDRYYLANLFSNSGIALSSVMYRPDANNLIRFADSGPYTESDLYLKLISIYGSGARFSEELLLYRHHSGSMSLNKLGMFRTIFDFYRRKLKFSYLISLFITSAIGLSSISRLIRRYF